MSVAGLSGTRVKQGTKPASTQGFARYRCSLTPISLMDQSVKKQPSSINRNVSTISRSPSVGHQPKQHNHTVRPLVSEFRT